MKKRKRKSKVTERKVNTTIQELSISRNGGQIALRGYTYQFMYSCYLILSTISEEISFQLEGIEDIDQIKCQKDGNVITHIQLKYSTQKQDASFLKGVLKSFLEAYLIDPQRNFKLVYDFPIANGYLNKLFQSDLDEEARKYWSEVINDIKRENRRWNWSVYSFDDFIAKMSFEKVDKNTLAERIENSLIEKYDIMVDNLSLYVYGIKVLCFEKMTERAVFFKQDLDIRISAIKLDISKGPQNPAHSWIHRIDYSMNLVANQGYYEGKKATPADIANGLPIHRPALEDKIVDAIDKNCVTVIKSSSGQGKTTLAYQVAYILQKDYIPYQLTWCNDVKELGNILQFFKARIQMGERPLILIDNLDAHLTEWNKLVQLMQSNLVDHFRFLITSRENDWYNCCGDISNIQSLFIIKPELSESEAYEIFKKFKSEKRLHSDITNWKQAWNRIADRQLLIEYVYLLTHGEMLADRISYQMSEIEKSSLGEAKCEILRKVCFADICGIRLSVDKIRKSMIKQFESDFGALLKSMKDEFLVHINNEGSYVEGLHPIRSRHIINSLCEFSPIDDTMLSVIAITQRSDLAVLFSHIPEFAVDKKEFFQKVVGLLWDEKDLSSYMSAIKGLFSGSVMQYYRQNKTAFDDANVHGGLFMLATEVCPFVEFREFNTAAKTLDEMKKLLPTNRNIQYLCGLRDSLPPYKLQATYVYCFSKELYEKLQHLDFVSISDIASYVAIAEWLYIIDPSFNLSLQFSLDYIWSDPEKYTLDCISSLMYSSYCGNKGAFFDFVSANLKAILLYLKHHTESQKMYIDNKDNSIHIEYILRLRDIDKGNEESVSRLKSICKMLPIFETYCADAIMPKLDLLSSYRIPDDAHKAMPIRNIIIAFHQEQTSLWLNTIMSNYEFYTVSEWLEYWINIRKNICLLTEKCCQCMHRMLEGKSKSSLVNEIATLSETINQSIISEARYPTEDRPFDKRAELPKRLTKSRDSYFQSINNFIAQLVGFLSRDPGLQKLAVLNLMKAKDSLTEMQQYYFEFIKDKEFAKGHFELCPKEKDCIDLLLMNCEYYQVHLPNTSFNKYHIKTWYKEHYNKVIDGVRKKLEQVSSEYITHFPNRFYTKGVLRYYPIIVEGIDVTSVQKMGIWFLNCVPFADTDFDYLIAIFADDFGNIYPRALYISKHRFIQAKQAIESNNIAQLENISGPYPMDVTQQMLDCFDEKWYLPTQDDSDKASSSVGNMAEELWVYSKLNELLTAPEDADYLSISLVEIESRVSSEMKRIASILPVDILRQIVDICQSVYDGQRFDDISLNNFIERFTGENKLN